MRHYQQTKESASSPPVIVLLTDFGSLDHYGGVVKGVVASICPNARIVDLSHEVKPYRIREAAYLLWASYKFFPKHSIFVCIVDPGVGSSRTVLLARSGSFSFLAPDNGLLDLVLAEAEIDECFEVKTQSSPFVFSPASATFQGRDVFAPVAAYLANGVAPGEFGPAYELPRADSLFVKSTKTLSGCVLHCDRYGNIVTNIKNDVFNSLRGIRIKKSLVVEKVKYYAEGKKNTLSLIRGSSGLVEIVMREESAFRKLKTEPETGFTIEWR